MKRLIFVLSIVCLLAGCNNGGMESTIQKEIEESFNEDNPFLGIWATLDNSEACVVFSDDYIVRLYHTRNDYDKRDPFFYATYTFDGSILTLSDAFTSGIVNGVKTPFYPADIILEFPYDFSSKHTFFILGDEIKKISVKF